VYGTGYHHYFYFRGEEWKASKVQPGLDAELQQDLHNPSSAFSPNTD
jgi:hypothetical protein